MRSRRQFSSIAIRRAALVGLAVVLSAIGAKPGRAETGNPPPPPAPAAPPSASASAPATASSTGATTGTDADGSGGGLFEQSIANAGAATTAAPESNGAAAPAAPFSLNGYVRGDFFGGKVPGESAAMTKANYGELALTLRTAKSRFGDGFAEARIRYGLQADTDGTVVDLREAYANLYLGPLDLRIGQQIIVWGRADALNPTNNLTPVDFRIRSPLEDDIRRGNAGVRAFLRFAPFRLEAVWLPLYLPTELPRVGLPQFVSFGTPLFPSADLRNSLGAGRLHLELPAIEMSVSYLYGYAPMPGLVLDQVTFDPVSPSVVVSRRAYDQHVVGGDFSTALGEVMTIRGEAAYRHPVDYQNRPYAARPDLQWVIGADHTFGAVSVIAQYMGRYAFDWKKQPGPTMTLDPGTLKMNTDPNVNPQIGFWMDAAMTGIAQQLAKTSQILFSQTERVQHIATLRFEWLLAHDALSLSSLCFVNFTTHEWLVTPRIGYHFSDVLTGYVGAQIFAGPDDTLFGLIDDVLSAGYVELRASF